MSSIESMILEIEKDYDEILKSFEKNLTYEEVYRFKEISEEELLKITRKVMNFQRKIEYFVSSTIELAKKAEITEKAEIIKRLKKIANNVLDKITDDSSTFGAVSFRRSLKSCYYIERDVKGMLPLLRNAHVNLLNEYDEEARRLCYCAYFCLKLIRPDLIELEEELRLISALTAFPISQKIALKYQLVIDDFEEVAVSLEEAESNIVEEHFKDCVSRCRDAIEIFIASIREKETGEKTERHFATDLGKLVKVGIFDEGDRRLAQGVYSYLSLKGSHKYEPKRVTIYDAETALKETYSLLEMLLKKYNDFKKRLKKKE